MELTAAVLTISDKGSRGERVDTAGPAVCQLLTDHGYTVVHTNLLPDDYEQIRAELIRCADQLQVCLAVTTGGTGFSQRDVTPEATLSVVEREARGIPEAMRAESLRITPMGCLSREAAGIRGETLIVNLPGSEKAARENLSAVVEPIKHGIEVLRGVSGDCAPLSPLS
jgi:molybdenum cofactor synthesis domain-containing protein